MRKIYVLFTACLISFVSYAQPNLLSAVTADTDANGRIDRIILTFDGAIDIQTLVTSITAGHTEQFIVAGYDISSVDTDMGVDSPIIQLSLVEGDAPDTDATPQVFIFGDNLEDSGNSTIVGFLSPIADDGAPPVIVDFLYGDGNDDGYIDEFTITFSEQPTGGPSSLRRTNLVVSDDGDFDGLLFGDNNNDFLNNNLSQLVTISGTGSSASTVLDTRDDSGLLTIALVGDFDIRDGEGNSYTNIDPQIQPSYTDGTAPVLISSETIDSDEDGQIDRIDLQFSEIIDPADLDQIPNGAGNTDQFDVNTPEYAISYVDTETGTPSQLVQIHLVEVGSFDTGVRPTITMAASSVMDLSGNLNLLVNSLTIDGAAPILITATTIDEDGNGHIDAIDVELSEPINDASLDGNLSLVGYTISGYSDPAGMGMDDEHVRILLEEGAVSDTGAAPEITNNGVVDGVLNVLANPQVFTETIDGAAPVILSVAIDDGTALPVSPENELNASEIPTFSMAVSEAVTASINIAALVSGRVSESMIFEDMDDAYNYSYTAIENGASMSNGLGRNVVFTADDGVNTPDTDNTINVDVDNVIPVLSINPLETTNTLPTITGTVTDYTGATISLSVVGIVTSQPVTNNNNGTWVFSIADEPPSGIYNVDVTAVDPFGNSASNTNDTNDELQIGGIAVTAPTREYICIDGSAALLDPIVLSETKINDFKVGAGGRTFFIDLPNGFAFDTSVTPLASGTHTDISNIVFSYLGTQTLRVQMNINDVNSLDAISIDGLQVVASGAPATSNATFATGTASIFGIADGQIVASLSSVNAPPSPTISDEDGGAPVTEISVEIDDAMVTLYADQMSSNSFRWYDHAGNRLHTGASAMMGELSDFVGPSGFDITTAGLYSIYVGEQDGQSCESVRTKVNIYVYDRQVAPSTFSFPETNANGVVISLANNLDFTGSISGPGLVNVVDDPGVDDAVTASARFIPSTVGVGDWEIHYLVTNLTTGESYDFVTVFDVVPAIPLFTNDVDEEYCETNPDIVLNVETSDIPAGSHFYRLQLRDEVGNVIDAAIPPAVAALNAPNSWGMDIGAGNAIIANKPTGAWTLNPDHPSLQTELDYSIERVLLPYGNIDPIVEAFTLNSAPITFRAVPEATINAPTMASVAYYCEDDDPFNFTATLALDAGISKDVDIVQYTIADLTNGNGSNIVVGNSFDPSDPMGILAAMGVPMGTYPVGQYSIDYTSNPLDDPSGCTDAADQITITVLLKPDPINLTSGILLEGRGELVDDIYTFEYCEGETIDPFEFSIEDGVDMVTVYANASLTSVLETNDTDDDGTLTVTGIDMFGSSQAVGGTDADFHYVYEILNPDGGCVANSIEVRYVVHEVPDNPLIDLTLSTFGGQVSNGVYEFNYCSGTPLTPGDLETIILNPLPVDGEAYFNIYDDGGIEIMQGLASSAIDLTDPGFDLALSPGSANEFYIEEVNFDNSFPGLTPPEGSEFAGCTSSTTTIFVNVHGIPSTPIQAEFSDNPHEVDEVIMYYLCQGDQLDFTINPPDGVNDYVYDWFEDELLLNPISVTDNQGNRIVGADLTDETFAFDPEIPNTYTMYTRLRSNVRVDADFEGCASDLIQVDVVVFPQSIDPSVSAVSSTSGVLTGGFTKVFDFCVATDIGLPEDTPFDTEVTFQSAGGNLSEVQWFEANEDGTEIASFSPVAVGEHIAASNLGIQGVRDVSLSYAVVHNTDIVQGYSNFEGCFSNEIEFVQINVTTQPNPNFTFFGIGEGGPTTFNFIDTNLDQNSEVVFEVRRVSDNSLEAIFNETQNVNDQEADFAPNLSAGVFEGTLTLTTNTGCQQSRSRTFRIQELVQVSGLLEEHFDNTSGGWFAEFQQDNGLEGSLSDPSSQRGSSWEYGVPDGATINSTWNGQGGAWMTTGNTTISDGSEVTNRYIAGEKSWVISPVYDLRDMNNPAISFLTYHDFELNAGVAFQYSLDRGYSWETLGNYDPSNPQDPSSGFGWYTENGNPGAPGNTGIGAGQSGFNPNRVAWSGEYTAEELLALAETKGWKESIHSIGGLAGNPSVMFRFALSALGADTDDLTTNGFGFDEMQIFELERNTIVEHFTTSISNDDLLLTTDVHEIIDQSQSLSINYFTDLSNQESSKDPINARNAPDPGARATYYGIGSSATVLDGELLGQEIATESSFSLTDLERKRLQSVLFSSPIIENGSTNPGILSLSASFTSRANVENRDLSAIIAIVEKEVVVSDLTGPIGLYKNGDVLKNVLRVLLPNAAGHNVVGDINVGETISVEADWAVYNVFDPTKLRVIAFIQDNETKEILQSGYLDVSTSEIVAGIEFLDKLSVSPIPADDHITIEFKDQISDVNSWSIFDMGGKHVSGRDVAKQDRTMKIDTRNVKSGMYLLFIYSEQENHGYPIRIIVEH